ncbi:MAG: GNAT family N-acetyltransferase [Pseudomonadota bacterium]
MDADYKQLILERKTWLLTDPKVDAFCVFYPMGRLMHLETVAVHPQAQGRGLGTGLVTACEAAAQAAGLIGVALYTNAKMEQNLRLYPRLGYQETDRRREAGFERVYFAKIWQTSAGDPLPVQGPSAKK